MIPGSLVAPFLPTFLIFCASTSSALGCATSPVLMQAALVQTKRAPLVVAQLSVARDHVVPFSKFFLFQLACGARTPGTVLQAVRRRRWDIAVARTSHGRAYGWQ
ncbi:TPA: hypothetical protein N0F65_001255 [Lagenidium giganteum]|uniref:Secreted protein n=1 Tax=Lagenidium giganteum TaxID=4803 RepID=A0AAV2YUM0_9STRA|nr:TPA: hypothetical protein N0F65_001255 [Lagenidium giganteum]